MLSIVKFIGLNGFVEHQGHYIKRNLVKQIQPVLEADDDDLPQQRSHFEMKNLLKPYIRLLNSLIKHQFAWPFNQPVDTRKFKDYLDHIKTPMDLSTVKNKAVCVEYSDVQSFIDDVRLVWSNALSYNPQNTDCYNMAAFLRDMFEKGVEKLRGSRQLFHYPSPRPDDKDTSKSKRKSKSGKKSLKKTTPGSALPALPSQLFATPLTPTDFPLSPHSFVAAVTMLKTSNGVGAQGGAQLAASTISNPSEFSPTITPPPTSPKPKPAPKPAPKHTPKRALKPPSKTKTVTRRPSRFRPTKNTKARQKSRTPSVHDIPQQFVRQKAKTPSVHDTPQQFTRQKTKSPGVRGIQQFVTPRSVLPDVSRTHDTRSYKAFGPKKPPQKTYGKGYMSDAMSDGSETVSDDNENTVTDESDDATTNGKKLKRKKVRPFMMRKRSKVCHQAISQRRKKQLTPDSDSETDTSSAESSTSSGDSDNSYTRRKYAKKRTKVNSTVKRKYSIKKSRKPKKRMMDESSDSSSSDSDSDSNVMTKKKQGVKKVRRERASHKKPNSPLNSPVGSENESGDPSSVFTEKLKSDIEQLVTEEFIKNLATLIGHYEGIPANENGGFTVDLRSLKPGTLKKIREFVDREAENRANTGKMQVCNEPKKQPSDLPKHEPRRTGDNFSAASATVNTRTNVDAVASGGSVADKEATSPNGSFMSLDTGMDSDISDASDSDNDSSDMGNGSDFEELRSQLQRLKEEEEKVMFCDDFEQLGESLSDSLFSDNQKIDNEPLIKPAQTIKSTDEVTSRREDEFNPRTRPRGPRGTRESSSTSINDTLIKKSSTSINDTLIKKPSFIKSISDKGMKIVVSKKAIGYQPKKGVAFEGLNFSTDNDDGMWGINSMFSTSEDDTGKHDLPQKQLQAPQRRQAGDSGKSAYGHLNADTSDFEVEKDSLRVKNQKASFSPEFNRFISQDNVNAKSVAQTAPSQQGSQNGSLMHPKYITAQNPILISDYEDDLACSLMYPKHKKKQNKIIMSDSEDYFDDLDCSLINKKHKKKMNSIEISDSDDEGYCSSDNDDTLLLPPQSVMSTTSPPRTSIPLKEPPPMILPVLPPAEVKFNNDQVRVHTRF